MSKDVLVVVVSTNLVIAGTPNPDKAVKTLSKKGYELTPEAFVESVDDGEIKIVELFLIVGMDPNSKDKRGKSAMHHAAEYADGVMTTMLIEAGADVNVTTEKGDTPLCDAADEEAHGSVSALIAGGAGGGVAKINSRCFVVTQGRKGQAQQPRHRLRTREFLQAGGRR